MQTLFFDYCRETELLTDEWPAASQFVLQTLLAACAREYWDEIGTAETIEEVESLLCASFPDVLKGDPMHIGDEITVDLVQKNYRPYIREQARELQRVVHEKRESALVPRADRILEVVERDEQFGAFLARWGDGEHWETSGESARKAPANDK